MSNNLPLTTLSEEEEMIKNEVKKFAQNKIKPLVNKMDEEAQIEPQIIKDLFELGFMGIEIPEEYGGLGANFFTSIIVIEEISKIDPAIGVMVDVHNTLVNTAILKWGTEEQKKKYLPQLAQGKIGAYSLSEANSGSDAFSLQTTAKKDGDYYILNGQKLWVTNAKEADIFIIFATVDKSKGYKGITGFIVEKGWEGFTIGKKENKLGIRASSTCELILENCKVPKTNILGEIGKGYKIAIESLNEGRIGIGAQMVGLAQGALEEAIKYSKEREQFGKPIYQFQAVQFLISELTTQLEAAKLMVYNAARLKETGKNFIKEAAMAKYFSSVTAEKVVSKSLEVFGGYGFTKEYPIEKYYRDVKVGQIYEGTSNMQLLTIAKNIYKK